MSFVEQSLFISLIEYLPDIDIHFPCSNFTFNVRIYNYTYIRKSSLFIQNFNVKISSMCSEIEQPYFES